MKKGHDTETWITELEDLCVRLEATESSVSENQCMIHILNNLTSDYELQLSMMQRRVGDTERPLTIEEIRGELSLCFERVNSNSTKNLEGEVLEEHALFSGQFKRKCCNCGQVGHKLFPCKNRGMNNGGNNGNSNVGIVCSYCCKPGHGEKNYFNLKRKEIRNNHSSNNNGNGNRQNLVTRCGFHGCLE